MIGSNIVGNVFEPFCHYFGWLFMSRLQNLHLFILGVIDVLELLIWIYNNSCWELNNQRNCEKRYIDSDNDFIISQRYRTTRTWKITYNSCMLIYIYIYIYKRVYITAKY